MNLATIILFGISAAFVFFTVVLLAITITLYRKQKEQQKKIPERLIEEHAERFQQQQAKNRLAAKVSLAIQAITDPQLVLPQAIELIQSKTGSYFTGLYLLDATGQYAVLKAGSGQAGQKMVAEGYQHSSGDSSPVGWVLFHRRPVVTSAADSKIKLAADPYLPETRAVMALPLLLHSEMKGVLVIHAAQPNTFSEDDLEWAQPIANSIATALSNCQKIQELEKRLDELQMLSRQYLQRTWTEMIGETASLQYKYENPEAQPGEEPQKPLKLPVHLHNRKIGQIALKTNRQVLTSEESALVEAITTQTALTLQNALLFEQAMRRAEREHKVLEITSKIRSVGDYQTIIQIALEELKHALNASRAQVVFKTAEDSAVTSVKRPGDPSILS